MLNNFPSPPGRAIPPAFVRIPWNRSRFRAKPVIDMGPDGIIFSIQWTVEDAELAVESCTYPPDGIRGYGPLRALEYGRISQCDFVDFRYRDMLRIIQIEHIDAVNCLEKLVEVEGIDGFIVGPNDLSASLGHVGRVQHPDMLPIYDRIGSILRDSGRLFGVSMGFVPEVIEQWLKRGANTIFAGNDVGYVYEGATSVKKGLDRLIDG